MTQGTQVAAERPAAAWPFYTEPSRLDVHGLEVAYRRAGQGAPTLYLHGAGLTRRWLPFYGELARSVDLVVPEHPGFGDTPLPGWLDDFSDLVLHYDALLAELDLDEIHLVGHSFGGWIAAELAIFYPRRIRSLTLITPAGLRVPGHPALDVFRMTPEETPALLVNGDPAPYATYFEEGDPVEALVQEYQELTAFGRVAWNPRYDVKLDQRLARITCPALVVAPDEDRIIPNEHFARWAELLPNGRLVTVSGSERPSGHLVIIQQPEPLAATIVDFVAQA